MIDVYTPEELYKLSCSSISKIFQDNIKILIELLNNFNKDPLLINYEGSDASGKETQSKLLSTILSENNISNYLFEFPNYKSTSPEMLILQKILSGEFGSISNINPFIRLNLFSIDRYNQKSEIIKSLDNNKITILDRYSLSNIYNIDTNGNFNYIDYMLDFEHNLLGMPIPDIVIYLDSSINFIEHNIKVRSKINKLDEFEKEMDFQKIILDRYNMIFNYIGTNENNLYKNVTINKIKCYVQESENTQHQLNVESIFIMIIQSLIQYLENH